MYAAAGPTGPPPLLSFWKGDFVRDRSGSASRLPPRASTPTPTSWNLGTAALVEQAIRRGEGRLTKDGPLLVDTGKHTGRSAKDKFIVRDATTEDTIWWDNATSRWRPSIWPP